MSVLEHPRPNRAGLGARLRQERQARNWSQARTARELRAVAPDELTSDDNLVRNLKRWEAGATAPSRFFQELLAGAFGTETVTLFPEQAEAEAGMSQKLAEEVSRGLVDAERAALAAQLQQMQALMEEMSQSARSRFEQLASTIGITHVTDTRGADDAVPEHVSSRTDTLLRHDVDADQDDASVAALPDDTDTDLHVLDHRGDVTHDVTHDVTEYVTPGDTDTVDLSDLDTVALQDDADDDVDGWEL